MSTIYSTVLEWAPRLILLFGSIILHEVAHGYAALRLGDTTARDAGRLSLNPLRHVDTFGTIVLPAILLISSGGAFSFGYAKPVPINPWRFRDRQTGMLITGLAGPLTNIVIGVVAALIFRFAYAAPSTELGYIAFSSLAYLAQINLILAFFNLIPIPPLDGSRVVQRFLSSNLRDAYHRLEPYGFVIIMAVSFLVPGVLNGYIDATAGTVLNLLIGG